MMTCPHCGYVSSDGKHCCTPGCPGNAAAIPRRRTDGISRPKFREIIVKDKHVRGIFWSGDPAAARAFARNLRALRLKVVIRRERNDQRINYTIGNFTYLHTETARAGNHARIPENHPIMSKQQKQALDATADALAKLLAETRDLYDRDNSDHRHLRSAMVEAAVSLHANGYLSTDQLREISDSLDDDGCPECERSNGPHYRGPCEHGAATKGGAK